MWWLFAYPLLILYILTGLYYRFRPLPPGINGPATDYRVPAADIEFLYNVTWYDAGERQTVRQICDSLHAIIRNARKFVVMDVFLFNLHHADDGVFIPTTRQIADEFQAKQHPCYFITDPLNVSYGTASSEPIEWLRQAGVNVCFTDLHRLRDNNLIFSPFWRLFLQWFGTGGKGFLDNPLRKGKKITLRAVFEAINARGNHRKVVIADEDESYVTLVTSSNFEDAGSFFSDTALKIRSAAVARHFLATEKAIARMSGCAVPVEIPEQHSSGDALVTPLMGPHIKRALLDDIDATRPGDELFVFMLFLSDRDIIEALKNAARRGTGVVVVLDQNKVSFGEPKSGYPNQFVAEELSAITSMSVRWSTSRKEEFHSKLVLLEKSDRCVIHTGSANLTRRSLSGTNPEANVRVEAPLDARVSQEVMAYARKTASGPCSVPVERRDRDMLRYLGYRFQEATGTATF